MRDRLLSIIDLSILLPEGSDRQFAVQNADLQCMRVKLLRRW